MRSTIPGSSFSGLFIRVPMGQAVIFIRRVWPDERRRIKRDVEPPVVVGPREDQRRWHEAAA